VGGEKVSNAHRRESAKAVEMLEAAGGIKAGKVIADRQ